MLWYVVALWEFLLSYVAIQFLSLKHTCTPGSMDYQEKYKYISEQLTVLKTEMDDLKNDDRVTRNDVIHESNFKRGRQSKRRMLDQVCECKVQLSLECNNIS